MLGSGAEEDFQGAILKQARVVECELRALRSSMEGTTRWLQKEMD